MKGQDGVRDVLIAANKRAMHVCVYKIGDEHTIGWGLFSDAQSAETTMRNHVENMHQIKGVPCLGGVVRVHLEANDEGNGSHEPWTAVCDDKKGVKRYTHEKTSGLAPDLGGAPDTEGTPDPKACTESTITSNVPW